MYRVEIKRVDWVGVKTQEYEQLRAITTQEQDAEQAPRYARDTKKECAESHGLSPLYGYVTKEETTKREAEVLTVEVEELDVRRVVSAIFDPPVDREKRMEEISRILENHALFGGIGADSKEPEKEE